MRDLLTPTGGSNLTFKVYFYFCISNDYLTFVTLAWSTKPVLSRWSIFVAIANNTLYGSNYTFFFYAKNHQIKSLLLSHHHSTSALVSEILMSVLQTVQKKQQFTYGQYIFTDCTEDNVQNTHTYTQYT